MVRINLTTSMGYLVKGIKKPRENVHARIRVQEVLSEKRIGVLTPRKRLDFDLYALDQPSQSDENQQSSQRSPVLDSRVPSGRGRGCGYTASRRRSVGSGSTTGGGSGGSEGGGDGADRLSGTATGTNRDGGYEGM